MTFNIFFFRFSNWHVVVPLKRHLFYKKKFPKLEKKLMSGVFGEFDRN